MYLSKAVTKTPYLPSKDLKQYSKTSSFLEVRILFKLFLSLFTCEMWLWFSFCVFYLYRASGRRSCLSNGHKGTLVCLHSACFIQYWNHLFLKSMKIVLVETLGPAVFFRLLSDNSLNFFLDYYFVCIYISWVIVHNLYLSRNN